MFLIRVLVRPSVALVALCMTVIASSGYGWDISYVDSSETYTSNFGSLALASDGSPWICYLRDAGGGSNWLMVAHLTPTGWEYEEVLYRVWPNPATVLMLDSNDYPHIVFHNIDGYRLDYAFKDQDGWHYLPTINPDAQPLGYFSAVLDAADQPHVSYMGGSYDLYHSWWDGSTLTWQHELVHGDGFNTGAWNSLALDSAGYPHITYVDTDDVGGAPGAVRYAYKTAAGWQYELVSSIGNAFTQTSLALDQSGWPHLCCFESVFKNLRYIYRDAVGWHHQTVDQNQVVGEWPSLALDPAGFPHVSYCWMFESPGSPSPGKLKYAYMDLAGWHITAVDSTEGDNWHMGLYSCLKLDACDRPHISSVDEEQAWTKYATEVMLRGVLAGDSLALAWSPVAGAAAYWVYGADNEEYFVPGMTAPYAHRIAELPAGTTSWSTTIAVTDPAHNWTYLVVPVDGAAQSLCVTNRVGEFDFDADTP